MINPLFSCCLVGCGSIGSKLISTPRGKYNFNHYDSINANPLLFVKAIYDIDESACHELLSLDSSLTILDSLECISTLLVDVLVISTPPNARLSIVKNVIKNKNIKVVVIEKPVASSFEESRELLSMLNKSGKTAIINFSRLFDPGILTVQQYIKSHLGSFQKGIVMFNKSFSNTGSHAVSLILHLLSISNLDLSSFPPNRNNPDYLDYPADIILSQIYFERINVPYSLLDISLYYDNGLLSIKGSGGCEISVSRRTPSNWLGYEELGPSFIIKERYFKQLDFMYNQISTYLQGHLPAYIVDNSSLGLKTAKIIEILESDATDYVI